MKRSLILTLAVALFAPISMMGCSEEAKTIEKKDESRPRAVLSRRRKPTMKKIETTGIRRPKLRSKFGQSCRNSHRNAPWIQFRGVFSSRFPIDHTSPRENPGILADIGIEVASYKLLR